MKGKIIVYLINFWEDLKKETPKIYQWFCGILIALSATAVSVSLSFMALPEKFQTFIPESVLQTVAVLSLVGALFAKNK